MSGTLYYTKLEPSELEASFRFLHFGRESRNIKIFLLISAVFHLITIVLDQLVMEVQADSLGAFHIMSLLRIVGAGLSLIMIRLVSGNLQTRTFDNIVTAWAIFVVVETLGANYLLPTDYIVHVSWDVLLVLAAYVVLPLSIYRQMIPALILSGGDIVLFLFYKAPDRLEEVLDLFVAFVCANIVGYFVSRGLHYYKREQFLCQKEAEKVRAELTTEKESGERLLQTISGCPNCIKRLLIYSKGDA